MLRLLIGFAAAAVAPVASFIVVGGGSWLWVRAVGRLPGLVLHHVALCGVLATLAVAAVAWRCFAHSRSQRAVGTWLVLAVVARLGDGALWDAPRVFVDRQLGPVGAGGEGVVAVETRVEGAGWGAHDGSAGLERRIDIACSAPGQQRAAVAVRRVAGTRMAWRERRLVVSDEASGDLAAVVDVDAPCAVHRGQQGIRFVPCDDVVGDEAVRIAGLRGRVSQEALTADSPCSDVDDRSAR